MRRASVTWTAEMTAELIVRTEAGESAAEIAERLGIKDRHVWKKREHLGIKPSAGITKLRRYEMDEARHAAGVEKIVWDADTKARLADMVARRVDLDEIADAFGTTSNAIATKISKMGLRRTD